MKRELFWTNGKLSRELLDGVPISDNIGKSKSDLGVTFNSKAISHQIQPIKPDEWPIWAKAFKWFASPEDKGIGDLIARKIGDETSEAFKAWHLATFGKPCNCTARRERWNRLYPLNQ